MIDNYSNEITPKTGKGWIKLSTKQRVDLIQNQLNSDEIYKGIEIVKVPDDGQVVLKINKSIPANERGLYLLKIEEIFKLNIDNGITIWLEPVGDKSKLRQLRGIKFT